MTRRVPIRQIIEGLPQGWQEWPYLEELADLTEQWIRDRNFYLLNLLHPEHATLKLISLEPHSFDSRLT